MFWTRPACGCRTYLREMDLHRALDREPVPELRWSDNSRYRTPGDRCQSRLLETKHCRFSSSGKGTILFSALLHLKLVPKPPTN